MSCAAFSDSAKELSPCSWGFSLIQRALVQIRCLSELDVQIKSSRGLPWKQLPRKTHDHSLPKEKAGVPTSTLSSKNEKRGVAGTSE